MSLKDSFQTWFLLNLNIFSLFQLQILSKRTDFGLKRWQRQHSQFIFLFGFNSFPNSDIPDTCPSIAPPILQRSDAQAAEFLRHLRFDSAISDFPMIAPSSIGEILAEHRPGRIIIAFQIVWTNKLKGSWGSLGRATSLGWLELDLVSWRTRQTPLS